MGKRGQVTLFIIVGIIVLVTSFFIIFLNVREAGEIQRRNIKDVSQSEFDIAPIQRYIDTCLEDILKEGVMEILGPHGGLIYPEGNMFYNASPIPNTAQFNGEDIPLYLDYNESSTSSFIPNITQMKKRFEGYLVNEIDECLDMSYFKERGYSITTPNAIHHESGFILTDEDYTVNADFTINLDDVAATVHYPLIIEKSGSETLINTFSASYPLRLGRIIQASVGERTYESISRGIAYHIKELWDNGEDFNLTEFHCRAFDSDLNILVYAVNTENATVIIVRDRDTWNHAIPKTLDMLFAVRNTQHEIFGSVCRGDS